MQMETSGSTFAKAYFIPQQKFILPHDLFLAGISTLDICHILAKGIFAKLTNKNIFAVLSKFPLLAQHFSMATNMGHNFGTLVLNLLAKWILPATLSNLFEHIPYAKCVCNIFLNCITWYMQTETDARKFDKGSYSSKSAAYRHEFWFHTTKHKVLSGFLHRSIVHTLRKLHCKPVSCSVQSTIF